MLWSNEELQTRSERDLLVRFCARYTGDADVAEDLAQQALLQAWQNEAQLRDPGARRSWLLGIARTTCLMWGRSHERERARRAGLDRLNDGEYTDRLADNVDLEMELEREELIALLDRAMAALPPDTREVLIKRYVEESPQAEVAAHLGLTEGAVEARLHRGKLSLKRMLTTELSDEAISFGLIMPHDAGWEETRVWCPGCGTHKLDGHFNPQEGELIMRCTECASPQVIGAHLGNGFRAMKTYRPAVSRVLDSIHELFRILPEHGATLCPNCCERVPIRHGVSPVPPPGRGNHEDIYLSCPGCGWLDSETWHSLTWSIPEVRRFWRENPRMRFMPEHPMEFAGHPAVLSGFESVTGAARIEVVTLRDTCEVVSITGAIPTGTAQE
jgi:RNA polymerase sigma factor (sigma-70 family)